MDPKNTDLIPLGDVPQQRQLPGRRSGKRVGKGTLYRWSMKGLRGGSIKLRTTLVGGLRCTTLLWLEEFLKSLNSDEPTAAAPPPRSQGKRSRAAAAARRRLEQTWDGEEGR